MLIPGSKDCWLHEKSLINVIRPNFLALWFEIRTVFFQSVTPPNIASRKFNLGARKFSDQRETSWSKSFNWLSLVHKWQSLVDFLKSKYTSIVKVQSKDDSCSIYPLSNVKNYGLIKLLSDCIDNFAWVKSCFENLFIHGTRQRDHVYNFLGSHFRSFHWAAIGHISLPGGEKMTQLAILYVDHSDQRIKLPISGMSPNNDVAFRRCALDERPRLTKFDRLEWR